MTKCCYSYNSMCSCTLGCMPVYWTLFHSHERLVGLCLQLVFRSTCHALTRACPNTGTPCFRTFGPGTRTWPVFAQGGGGVVLRGEKVCSSAGCARVQHIAMALLTRARGAHWAALFGIGRALAARPWCTCGMASSGVALSVIERTTRIYLTAVHPQALPPSVH